MVGGLAERSGDPDEWSGGGGDEWLGTLMSGWGVPGEWSGDP